MALTESYKRLSQAASSASSSSGPRPSTVPLPLVRQHASLGQAARALSLAEDAAKEAQDLREMLVAATDEIASLRREALPTFVARDDGFGIIHECGNSFVDLPRESWRTRCGWRYGGVAFRRLSEPHGPAERHCSRCFRALVGSA